MSFGFTQEFHTQFQNWWLFILNRWDWKRWTLENLAEMMSSTCFEIVAQFQKRLPYSFLNQIFLQWDILEKEYMKFDMRMIVNWESSEFVVRTQSWLLNSFVSLIFLQLVVQEKEYMKQNMGKKIMDKVVKNLTQGRCIPIDYVKSEN